MGRRKNGEWKTEKYTGEMKDGKQHGRGVYVWANSDRYDGDWKGGKRNGRGVFVWANGDRYEGEYRDDKPNGSGTATINRKTYSGYWTNGCFKQGNRTAMIGTSKAACGFK